MKSFKNILKKVWFLALLSTVWLLSSVSAAPGLWWWIQWPSVKMQGIPLQNVEVPVWTTSVDALYFGAGASEDAQVRWLMFQWNQFFDANHIETARLWQLTNNGWSAVGVLPGTLINDGDNTLLWDASYGNIVLDASTPEQFLLTVDIVDDNNLLGHEISVKLVKAKIAGLQTGLPATVYGLPVSSNNTITLIEQGKIKVDGINLWDAYVFPHTDDVEALKFVLVSSVDAEIEDMIFEGGEDFDDEHLDDAVLYMKDGNDWIALDNVNINSSTNSIFEIENMGINIDAYEEKMFLLTLDIVNNNSALGGEISVDLIDLIAENISSGNDIIDLYGLPASSNNTIYIDEATLAVNALSLSDVEVLFWSYNVDAMLFEAETGIFPVEIDEMLFIGNENFDEDHITAVRLWMETSNYGRVELETHSGFDIYNNAIEFDDLDVYVPANSTQVFLLTVDISDDPSIIGDMVSVQLVNLEANDDNHDPVAVEWLPADSGRDITIVWLGSLEITPVLLSDIEVSIGSDEVDALKFTAEANNALIEIEDMTFVGNSDFDEDHVMEVKLWKEVSYGWELIDTEPGFAIDVNNEVEFNNIDVYIPENSTQDFLVTLDIVDDTNIIGDIISLRLTEVEAEDENSGEDVEAAWLPADSGRAITLIQ